MAFCTSCGSALDPSMTFCPRCGAQAPALAPGTAAGPAPGPAPAPGAKLDFGVLFQHGLHRATGEWRAYLGTSGLVVLLSVAIGLLGAIYVTARAPDVEALVEADDVAGTLAAFATYAGRIFALSLVTGTLNALAFGLGLVVSDALERGEQPTFAAAWSTFATRLGSYAATYVLIALAVIGLIVGGLALLIVGVIPAAIFAVYLAVCWMLAPAIALFESRGATENLRRSRALTKGNRGVLFGVAFVLGLIGAIPGLVVGGTVGALTAVSQDPALASSPLVLAIQALVALPFTLFVSFALPAAVHRAYRALSATP